MTVQCLALGISVAPSKALMMEERVEETEGEKGDGKMLSSGQDMVVTLKNSALLPSH